MGQSVFPVPSSGYSVPNWQPVTSSTPSGVSTVTFSGLSGYSKYRIMAPNCTVSTSGGPYIRFNGDSGTNYNDIGTRNIVNSSNIANLAANIGATYINCASPSGSGSTKLSFDFDIDDALTLCPKRYTGWATQNGSDGYINVTGMYATTALLTSITINGGANFVTGSIYLLGAN